MAPAPQVEMKRELARDSSVRWRYRPVHDSTRASDRQTEVSHEVATQEPIGREASAGTTPTAGLTAMISRLK
jgi:hypothetical protein